MTTTDNNLKLIVINVVTSIAQTGPIQIICNKTNVINMNETIPRVFTPNRIWIRSAIFHSEAVLIRLTDRQTGNLGSNNQHLMYSMQPKNKVKNKTILYEQKVKFQIFGETFARNASLVLASFLSASSNRSCSSMTSR